jgi:cytochrome P450
VTEAAQQPAPLDILNRVVLELFSRTTLAPAARPERLGTLLVIETPDEAAQVLDHPALFHKNFALVAAFGPSRFNQNGPVWETLRPRTQRAYARAGRPVQHQRIARIYDDELAAAAPSAAGIEAALARAALRVFFDAFGLAPDVGPFLAHFARLRRIAADLQRKSWQGTAPEEGRQITALAAAALADYSRAVAAEPRVSALIDRLAAETPALARGDMLADFMTNMFAGIETTTAALGWMIDCLGRNGSLQDALRAEARAGGGPLLRSFRDECLRVFSPIPFVVREAAADVTLGRHRLREGELVLLSLVGLHRDPASWVDPLAFHAARVEFAPDAAPNPAFRPFLSGPRACGGRRIAEMELTEALRLLLLRFRLTSPEADPAFDYALAFRPRLTPRHRAEPLA